MKSDERNNTIVKSTECRQRKGNGDNVNSLRLPSGPMHVCVYGMELCI